MIGGINNKKWRCHCYWFLWRYAWIVPQNRMINHVWTETWPPNNRNMLRRYYRVHPLEIHQSQKPPSLVGIKNLGVTTYARHVWLILIQWRFSLWSFLKNIIISHTVENRNDQIGTVGYPCKKVFDSAYNTNPIDKNMIILEHTK